MSRNLIIAAIALIVLIGGVVLVAGNQGQKKSESSSDNKEQMEEKEDQEEMEKESDEEEDEDEKEDAMMESATSVTIQNFAFSPKTITIKKGTKVTWTNQDSVKHNAVADDGSFETDLMGQGESETETFDKVGTFTYHCTPHPSMKATIIVE